MVLLVLALEPAQFGKRIRSLFGHGRLAHANRKCNLTLPLAMPMIPVHAEGECDYASPVTTGKSPVTEKRANPFAELRGFKGKSQ